MKAKIFSHEKHIGTTELHVGDESMCCLYGDFTPTEHYFKYVQKKVWDFWSTRKPDYKKWAALRLNVQLDNGYFLFAAGGYTIDDIEESQVEPKRIDVAGVDWHVIEDFFSEPIPRVFTEEPWEDISVEQKIAFENELRKEIGVYEEKSFWDLFSSKKSSHLLANFEISALCTNSRNDDVLFITRNRTNDIKYAIIHLTWKGAEENDNYPKVKFYDSFDDFKYKECIPTK